MACGFVLSITATSVYHLYFTYGALVGELHFFFPIVEQCNQELHENTSKLYPALYFHQYVQDLDHHLLGLPA